MEKKIYFAYGSNLNHRQMAYRCPDAEFVGTITVENRVEIRFGGQIYGLSGGHCINHALNGFPAAQGAYSAFSVKPRESLVNVIGNNKRNIQTCSINFTV